MERFHNLRHGDGLRSEDELNTMAVFHSPSSTTVAQLQYARTHGIVVEVLFCIGQEGMRKRMLLEMQDVDSLDGPLKLFEGFDDFYLIDLCRRDPSLTIRRYEIHAFLDDYRFAFAFTDYQLTEYEEGAEPAS